jgi:hypothetical protein
MQETMRAARVHGIGDLRVETGASRGPRPASCPVNPLRPLKKCWYQPFCSLAAREGDERI